MPDVTTPYSRGWEEGYRHGKIDMAIYVGSIMVAVVISMRLVAWLLGKVAKA